MVHEHRKSIILRYMELDLAGAIPDRPAFVPGIGNTPSVRLHADDTFRMIVECLSNPEKQELVDLLLVQLENLIKIK